MHSFHIFRSNESIIYQTMDANWLKQDPDVSISTSTATTTTISTTSITTATTTKTTETAKMIITTMSQNTTSLLSTPASTTNALPINVTGANQPHSGSETT